MIIPTQIVGGETKQVYAPYLFGSPNNWLGDIERIYLVSNVNEVEIALPPKVKFENFSFGYSETITLIQDIVPNQDFRIAFFNPQNISLECSDAGVFDYNLRIPHGLKNISASSYIDRPKQIKQRNVAINPRVYETDIFKDYEGGEPVQLEMLSKIKAKSKGFPSTLDSLLSVSCPNDTVVTNLNHYCHPVFAFDLAKSTTKKLKNAPKDFHFMTAWCESEKGNGIGEFIEFELTQPARTVSVFNGYQFSDEKFKINSRVSYLQIASEDSSFVENVPAADLQIQNLYPYELAPGKYRITIKDVIRGEYPNACISAIVFDFAIDDNWFNENYTSITKKEEDEEQ
jgi:hypothetical protein